MLVRTLHTPRADGAARSAALAVLTLALGAGTGCDRRIDVDFNHAFERRDWAWAESLLAQGADIDARYKEAEGFTTLMMAVREAGNTEGVVWLLEHGADPNVPSFKGRAPLHVAASAGIAEHVRLLLAAGADVNARTADGDTPLAVAREKGHEAVERLILAAGGDL